MENVSWNLGWIEDPSFLILVWSALWVEFCSSYLYVWCMGLTKFQISFLEVGSGCSWDGFICLLCSPSICCGKLMVVHVVNQGLVQSKASFCNIFNSRWWRTRNTMMSSECIQMPPRLTSRRRTTFRFLIFFVIFLFTLCLFQKPNLNDFLNFFMYSQYAQLDTRRIYECKPRICKREGLGYITTRMGKFSPLRSQYLLLLCNFFYEST